MNLEMRIHYWPATPDLREVKIFIDGKEIVSSFMNRAELLKLAETFQQYEKELIGMAWNIQQ